MNLKKFYREDHTFYKKPSSLRWTWKSPDGSYHNEIDHIIVSKRFCLTDFAVDPSFIRDRTIAFFEKDFLSHGEEKRPQTPKTIIDWELFVLLVGFWEDTVMDNIDDEYERLVEHLRHYTKKAKSLKTTMGRLSLKTLGLIRQRGTA
ncbi:hypothetical protein NECAME_04097 [Necator americanus]|uniref:Uncharacterized protein n=1 Tax=Necator americanus TaxID=51031 RepID=W2SZT1_NECAM|nr:hypothetical protein NECAME_04097 [Necator americanus]ETN74232.1 hypothetical protein NECAME_04097 [Necator americanus]